MLIFIIYFLLHLQWQKLSTFNISHILGLDNNGHIHEIHSLSLKGFQLLPRTHTTLGI
jgi:hypothetical protein